MLELSPTRIVQYTGDETGFIRVELVNKLLDNKRLEAYAKVESSYTIPFLAAWDEKYNRGITYDEPTSSFLFSDGTTAYTVS